MHDGKALQAGTSHNFGDGFAHAFGIQYTDKENKLQYVHQTSASIGCGMAEFPSYLAWQRVLRVSSRRQFVPLTFC